MRLSICLLSICFLSHAGVSAYPSKSSLCVAYLAQQSALERRLPTSDTREKTLATLRDFRVSAFGHSGFTTHYKPVSADASAPGAEIGERISGIEWDKQTKNGPQVFASTFRGQKEIEGFFGELDLRRSMAEDLLSTNSHRLMRVAASGVFTSALLLFAHQAIRGGQADGMVVALSAGFLVDMIAGIAVATDFAHPRNREQLVHFLNTPPSDADPGEWVYNGRNYKIQKALVAALQDATADLRFKSGGQTQGSRDHHFVAAIPAAFGDYLRGDQPYSSVLVDEFLHREPETGEPLFSFVIRIYQDRTPRPRRRRLTDRVGDWVREAMTSLVPPTVAPGAQRVTAP